MDLMQKLIDLSRRATDDHVAKTIVRSI